MWHDSNNLATLAYSFTPFYTPKITSLGDLFSLNVLWANWHFSNSLRSYKESNELIKLPPAKFLETVIFTQKQFLTTN